MERITGVLLRPGVGASISASRDDGLWRLVGHDTILYQCLPRLIMMCIATGHIRRAICCAHLNHKCALILATLISKASALARTIPLLSVMDEST